MFEDSLKEKLKTIFKVKKVSFDQPGSSQETECLFVDIESAKESITDNKAKAMVTGSVFMFAPNDKLPFGYLFKMIQDADEEVKKDLHFVGREENTKIFRDKVQRSVGFVYFFSTQYDPDDGSITSVNIIDISEE